MKNKGCLILAGIFILLLTIGLIYYFVGGSDSGPEKFETTKPEIRNILQKAVATGSIKPRQEINIKPQVSGIVDELYVEAGQLVSKGQKIAKIKLIPSQVNINSAQSNVELANIRLAESKRAMKNQKEISQQNLDTDQAKVALDIALKEEERNRTLLKDGVISDVEYNQFKLDLELKKSVYENTKINSGNVIRQFESEVDIRNQELREAQNNLQLLKEGATRNSKQVSNIIASTVNGMILDVPVEEGSSVIERNNFNEGTSIADIADMGNLIFEGKVDESDVGKLKEGMPLVVTVGAIIDTSFKANLEFISPKGVEEEGTVKFEIKAALVEIPEDVFLRAGYSANADVILQRKDSVISINERDIIYAGDTTFVELQKGENEFDKKEIELGLSDGMYAEVLTGIDTSTVLKKRIDQGAKETDAENNN